MATALEKPVTRQTPVNGVDTQVTITQDGVTFKKHGNRVSYSLSYAEAIAAIAAKAEAAGDKATTKKLKEDGFTA